MLKLLHEFRPRNLTGNKCLTVFQLKDTLCCIHLVNLYCYGQFMYHTWREFSVKLWVSRVLLPSKVVYRRSNSVSGNNTWISLLKNRLIIYECFSISRPQIWPNASQFDRRLFRSKVVSIDKSRFDGRQESVQSVSTELTIYQICLNIFSLAVDKRTKNNQALSRSFYHHLPFYQNLCFDRTDVCFRSNELSIETTFDRTDSIPFDPCTVSLLN